MAPGGATQVAAVIGSPVAHSLSPAIHNAGYAAEGLDWVFLALEVRPGEAGVALAGARALGLRGLSVTMPHKEDAAAAVDRLSPSAARLGAVNCVVVERDGTLAGHNTDGPGFVDALVVGCGFEPRGRRALVVGAGGAARAIVLALGEAGAADVAVLNRTPQRGEAAAALAGRAGRLARPDDVAGADLVVNATPIGMLDEGLPLDPAHLHGGQVVVDTVYHPARTPLLAAAEAAGATTANGLGMLVHQAAHAFRLHTGRPAPVEAMWDAARASAATNH